MFRFILWLGVYLILLGTTDIEVTYKDGLHINLKGWWPKKED